MDFNRLETDGSQMEEVTDDSTPRDANLMGEPKGGQDQPSN